MAHPVNSPATTHYNTSTPLSLDASWRAALDAVREAVCLLSEDRNILFANQAMCMLVACPAAELKGRSLEHLLTPADHMPSAHQPLARGPSYRPQGKDEHILTDRHGQEHWVRLALQPVDEGGAAQYMATLTNITRDMVTNQRLQGVLDAADLGTWEWNVQSGEVIFNERWAGMLGYTLPELSPLSVDTWVNLVHPDDLGRSNAALARHFRGESPSYQCDCRLRHKSGQWIWVATRGRLLTRTPEGNPLLVYGTHQDVSQHKRVMEALQQSEHSYELMALGTPSALYDWDVEKDQITWRGKSFEVLGAIGNLDLPTRSVDFQNWVHPEDWARYRRTLRRYFKRDTQILHDDLRLIRPDGEIIWVEYHGAALWQQGRARRLFGSFTNASLHKQTDLRMKQAFTGLAEISARLESDPNGARTILRALQAALKPPL